MKASGDDAAIPTDLLNVEQRKNWIDKHNELLRDMQSPYFPCHSSLSTWTEATSGSYASRLCKLLPVVVAPSPQTGQRHHELSLLSLNSRKTAMSHEDKKIINLMVLRREAKIAEEEIANAAHNLWYREKLEYNQALNDRQQQWRNYVNEKRNFEKMELNYRKKMLQDASDHNLSLIAAKVQAHHDRNNNSKQYFPHHKALAKSQSELDHYLFHKLKNDNLEEERSIKIAEHLKDVMEKERKAEFNLCVMRNQLNRRLQDMRLKREVQEEAARAVREAGERADAEKADQQRFAMDMRLQQTAARASLILDTRRNQLRQRNRLSEIHHAHAIASLKEEEKARELRLRQELLRKDSRVKEYLNEKEDMRISTRVNALAAANLRHKIQSDFPLYDL